ncbi:histidine phosphatase family protein [Nocardia sp. NPDC004722]
MSSLLYLVRHGETDWNQQRRLQGRIDQPMNNTGRNQALGIATGLCGRNVHAVVVSPLVRAYETGSIIARYFDLPEPSIDERLVERCYGSGEGLTASEISQNFGTMHALPGLEPEDNILHRVLPSLTEIAADSAGRSVVVATHGAVIRAVVRHISPGTADVTETPIRNGSVHSFRWTLQGGTLLCFDDPVFGAVPSSGSSTQLKSGDRHWPKR